MSGEAPHLRPCCARSVSELLKIFRGQFAEAVADFRREFVGLLAEMEREREEQLEAWRCVLSDEMHRSGKRLSGRAEARELAEWERTTGNRLGGGFRVPAKERTDV